MVPTLKYGTSDQYQVLVIYIYIFVRPKLINFKIYQCIKICYLFNLCDFTLYVVVGYCNTDKIMFYLKSTKLFILYVQSISI